MTDLKELIEIAIRDMEKHLNLDSNQFYYGDKNDNIIKTLKEAMALAYETGQKEAYKKGREDEKYHSKGPRISLY